MLVIVPGIVPSTKPQRAAGLNENREMLHVRLTVHVCAHGLIWLGVQAKETGGTFRNSPSPGLVPR